MDRIDSENILGAAGMVSSWLIIMAVVAFMIWITEPWWGPISKRNEEMRENEREEARQMAMKAMKYEEKNNAAVNGQLPSALSIEIYNDFYRESLRKIRVERKPKPFAFHETIEGRNFIETAEERSTSIDVMRGIAQTSGSLHEANFTWEHGVAKKSHRQISLLVIAATLDGKLDWHKLRWGDKTLFEVVTHGISGQTINQKEAHEASKS